MKYMRLAASWLRTRRSGGIVAHGPRPGGGRGPGPFLPAVPLLLAFVASGAAGPAAPRQDPSVRGEEILGRVQARYAAMPGLKADFVQIWRAGRFSQEVRESGTLWIRRPGLARWEYLEPERKVAIVTAARETWFYMPGEGQAIHGRLEGGLPPHLALLMGEVDVRDAFRVVESRIAPPGPGLAGLAVLTLEPAGEEGAEERVVLTVETEPLRISSVALVGPSGDQTEYIFLDPDEGFVAPESLFEFEPPEGVEVIEEGAARGEGEAPR